MSRVRTFALDGRSEAIDSPVRVRRTIFLPSPTTATVTASLSAVSLGVNLDTRTMGVARAFIDKVGVVPPGARGASTVDLSSQFRTEGTFERCVFVTFLVSVVLAEAIGTFVVFTDD